MSDESKRIQIYKTVPRPIFNTSKAYHQTKHFLIQNNINKLLGESKSYHIFKVLFQSNLHVIIYEILI